MIELGRLLILVGILLMVIGGLVLLSQRFNVFSFLGRLPGDIFIKGEKFTFYFPIVTCIIISLILTFLFNLFKK